MCYGFAAVFNLIFDYFNFWRRGAPYGVDDGTVGEGAGKFPWAVNTNHPCISNRLAAVCDASFDRGLPTPSLGEGVVV